MSFLDRPDDYAVATEETMKTFLELAIGEELAPHHKALLDKIERAEKVAALVQEKNKGIADDCLVGHAFTTGIVDDPYEDAPDELFGDVAEKANPKTVVGNTKPSITAIPGPAILHCALAMQNGVTKYTKYNWRESRVPAATYVDAAIRHLLSWADGEEIASDSGVHHLAHAMACCAILLDAIEGDHLIDNRGPMGKTAEVINRMQGEIPGMIKRWEADRDAKTR